MGRLTIARFQGLPADLEAAVTTIRNRLSPSGDVVSKRGKRLTQEVFGSALTPRQVVDRICEDVRVRGLTATLEYVRKLDGADLAAATLRVPIANLEAAHAAAEPKYLQAIRNIRRNIQEFQSAILHRDIVVESPEHRLRLRHRPIHRVGVCIPGGAAAYPSTLLMTAVPAQTAGVPEIVVISPPTDFGANNADLLAACFELGVTEVYRMGGAQGVASLAYGVEGIPPVDKIVGPGNLFVALAKQRVSEVVGIDMMAGPTEVIVLADDSAEPRFVAADLLSQAEHAPGASILITWSPALADAVQHELDRQIEQIDRRYLTIESLERYAAIIVVADERTACQISDQLAPEHLEIQTVDPEATLKRIQNAGAIFLGRFTPVAVGDYVAGPSHTLPTGGSARFANGLSANDFLVRQAVIEYSETKLRETADDLRIIAGKEGLTAHAKSVDIRLS